MKLTIGKPIANTQIYIVDKYLNIVPIGITGELCIAGDCVGAGYLNRPELTAEKFIDNPFGKGKMYKTGDLAYWREDGNIAYVGRNDFQVKIRGLRIELGEIENAISSVDGINMSVVVVRKNSEGRQLICAFYTGEEKSAQEIRGQIGTKLPKYMLPHIFTHLDEIPLTSSGKISRKTLPEIDLENIETAVEYVAPETESEQALVESVKAVLGCEKVSTLDNFFDIGGDSLKAIELTSQLESKGYDVQIKTIFDCETLQDLAKELTSNKGTVAKVEYGNVIHATPAQMRVYTAQSKNENSTLYNIPYIFKVDELDVDKLQIAVNKLIERHESLRTHFENQDGQIMQVIDDTANVTVEKLSSDDVLSFIRPFDLEKSPLLRVGYYENTVMIDIHHIISDGGTMPVFFKELNELYMGRAIENDAVQYGEFAMQEVNLEESEKYWLSVFNDEIPALELQTDIARTDKQSFNGNSVYDSIDIDLHNRILAKCKELNITPYVFYMSCFNILLSKFSGNEDIVVGMPVSGRSSHFLNTIGMFVNTVALRSKPEGNKTIVNFFNEVKSNSVEAIDNQNYPFGELVKKLNIESTGRNPLFDVMFAYQSEQMTDVVFGDKKAELLPVSVTSAKCDFTFNIMPRNDDVVVMVEYCTDLYKEKKIQKFIDAFKLILEQCLDEKMLIKDGEAMNTEEIKTLMIGFNNTAISYSKSKCVHQLFEEQVEKNPDKIAVVACDKTLTYRELNEEANRIANSLINKGVSAGDIVAYKLSRKSCVFSAVMGILKSGAAYLPIDPDYPQDRIDYMLEDSNTKFCITEDNIFELLENKNICNPCVEISSDNICYCIYTSGSTGKPKGVLITHKNVVNYCDNNNNNNTVVNILNAKGCETIVSTTTVGFDIFVTESILPLLNGIKIIFADEKQSKIQHELNELFKTYPADILQTTPSKMKMLISDKSKADYLKALKVVILGGETLEKQLLDEVQMLTDADVYNIYGPTETTVWVTNGLMPRLNRYDYRYIKDIEALTKEEKYKLLFEFNDTEVYYQMNKCVHQLFEEQVGKNPDKIAVVASDKTLTYRKLNEDANRIAHSLIGKGVSVGDIVAFKLSRKSYALSSMIGILKSGAAYLPIDPDYPQDRIDYMLEDSNAKFCITDENISELLNNKNTDNPSVTIISGNICYCIYTSGSTGKPKGVLITHNNVSNFCNVNSKNYFQDNLTTNCDKLVCLNNLVFDITLQETLLPILNGLSIQLIDNEGIFDIEKANLPNSSESVGLIITPSKLSVYLNSEKFSDFLSNVKVIMVGAEMFPLTLYNEIRKHTKAIVFNGYGPTETTCGVSYGLIKNEDIHIGKPLANTQIYIVDKYMKPVPIGVTGELCIAGDCVGAGYLNRPELTAEKFVDNPFGEGKMYKTGDLAYWREDGNIAYVGRNDFQVKIRGLRIELGEIENAISSVEGINLSVVVVRKNSEGRQLICAFYTGEEKTVQEIKSVIGEKLPKYMLPHIFTHLDEMPLTSSGKISRKTLPEIDLENISNDTEYVAPITETEKLLCSIASETLGIEKIGVEDDFFELGGDSLKAIEYVSKAHAQGVYFALQDVFDNPTVKLLCEFMTAKDKQHNTYNIEDFKEIHKMLESNLDDEFVPAKSDMGDVLLTGATGFLGIHVVSEFLENENGKVYCLVRGKDNENATDRFIKLLNYYFDGKYVDLIGSRIIVLCGDVEKENLGLDVIPEVSMVINTAASVKHYGSYKYFHDINVGGAINSMNVAKAVDARFIQVSTLSVSGNSMVDIFDAIRSEEYKTFSENDLYIEQQLDNVYIRSKFEAEYAIFKEMLNGLKANIIRVGNLTNRASDFKFQPNYQSNAFLSRVKAVLEMGMFPDYLTDLYAEFSPIDDTANAVLKIAQHFNDRKTVFHVNSQKVVYFDKFIEYTGKLGINLDVLTGKEFADRLAELEHNETTRYIYEALINDMDENGNLVYDSNIHIENEHTLKYLDKIGFDWSEIGLDYLKGYFDYFRNLGYLEV